MILILRKKNRPSAAAGSAAILAAVSGILPETLRASLASEIGVLPRRGFGKMPNPAAKMAALPEDGGAPRRWRRSPKKKDKGIKNKRGESAFAAGYQNSASEDRQHHCRWFRDAGNTEADVAVLVRRVEVEAGRGGQGADEAAPRAPTQPARRAGDDGVIPLPGVAALATRARRIRRAIADIDQSGGCWIIIRVRSGDVVPTVGKERIGGSPGARQAPGWESFFGG